MSIEQLQQRLSDLRFSLEETIKAAQQEQDESERAHSDWEEDENAEEGDEPYIINNEHKINALENAKDKIDEAITALDAALED